jgi:response regulator of citrate/malate metabolism
MNSTPIPSAHAIRALIIDDDEFMLDLNYEVLQQLGLRNISKAKSSDEALRQIDNPAQIPNLLLVDLHMPHTDGFQFMGQLSKRKYTGGVIVVSGQRAQVLQSADLMAQLYDLNILGTLEKPVNPAALARAINKFKCE